jgi:hypothetical protein
MKSLSLLISMVLLLLLTACAAKLSHHQLALLSRGMSQQEVLQKISLPPETTVSVAIEQRRFEVQRYMLFNGMNTDNYFLAYERGGLLYWGYVNEFRRHPDPSLGRAMDAALAAQPVPR